MDSTVHYEMIAFKGQAFGSQGNTEKYLEK